MQRHWTDVSEQVIDNDHTEDRRLITRDLVSVVIDDLEWIDLTARSIGAMPANASMAIDQAIRTLSIPKVSRYAISNVVLAPYRLYGIEGNYHDGRAQIFVLDLGSEAVPLCSDFYPKEALEINGVEAR